MSHHPKRILIIEDDKEAGQHLCDLIRQDGLVPIGPAPTVFYAARLLGKRDVDAAVMDTSLYGQPVFEFADEFLRRDRPFIFLKAPDTPPIPSRFDSWLCLEKPCDPTRVLAAIRTLPGFHRLHPATTSELEQLPATAPGADDHGRMIRTICKLMREDTGTIETLLGPAFKPRLA